jgi:hypothetical protein
MKNTILKKILYTGLLAGSLAACGDDPALVGTNNPYGAAGTCQVPMGIKDRTVMTVFEAGGTLELDIYSAPNGGIEAIGRLTLPSVEQFTLVNGGGLYNYGPAQPNSQFRTCLSTMGTPGNLVRGYSQQDIDLTLYGDAGTIVQMGASLGLTNPAYLTGDGITGQFIVQFQGVQRIVNATRN